jgi:hypothetical protein
MDETQTEPRVAQESVAARADDARDADATALGQVRLLANPRRVRRA